MESVFFHIDVNSAFLSWTAIDQKMEAISQNSLDQYIDIREIPAIIGGDSSTRHGIVLAKSIPAKKYGIETAEPIVSALKKCPNLKLVSPNHQSYQAHSKAFIEHLMSFCPVIEQVSIDECFMDFTPIYHDYPTPIVAANIIRESVYDHFGFTVNIGISNRKVLAKMASDFKKPNFTHTLFTDEIRQKMWPLPVSSLFMCGKSSQEVLKNLGITTIGQLACTDQALLYSHLKSHGTLLWEYANGIDSSIVDPIPAPVKGIGNSTTLSKDASSIEDMKPHILSLSESVAKRLRHNSTVAYTITVEIKYASFQSVSHQKALTTPTNTTTTIYEISMELLKELWNGSPVRLLGVRATKLSEENAPVQMDLFSYATKSERSEKEKKVDAVIDEIRQKFGNDAIKRGTFVKKS